MDNCDVCDIDRVYKCNRKTGLSRNNKFKCHRNWIGLSMQCMAGDNICDNIFSYRESKYYENIPPILRETETLIGGGFVYGFRNVLVHET